MKIDTRDTLVAEVANALSENFDNITSYLNLTTQEVGEYMDSSLCGDDCKWPNDGDEVIRIEPLSSRESFYAMAEFADKQPDDISQKLYDTLNKKHPFANFKEAINRLNITQQWYDFSKIGIMQKQKNG